MRITRLVLTDFRNYERLSWAPQSRLVVLTGENGAGKTNLLEAVSLLAPGRGLRSASNTQIQRQHAGSWGVVASLESPSEGQVSLATGSDPRQPARRVFQLDGESVRSHAEIANLFSCVWLTPPMDRLFSDPASGRRRFLDRLVLAFDSNHAGESAAHERAVLQRNRLLATSPSESAWLNAIEDSIARHAVALTASRSALIQGLNEQSETMQGALGGAFPAARLNLDCAIGALLDQYSALEVEERIRAQLLASRQSDRERGATSIGGHRADFRMCDAMTGREAELSSSGQQKAMLLHTIIVHAQLMTMHRKSRPVVLLDEPLVHLDEPRREALLAILRDLEMTAIITGTDRAQFSLLEREAELREVSNGQWKAMS